MNMLQSRLEQIELKNKNKKLKHQINRITRDKCKAFKTTPFHFKQFLFNGNIHSINLKTEKFTNYVKSEENTYYKILKKVLDKIYYDKYNILKEFNIDDTNYCDDSATKQRLKRIIMESNCITDIELIPKIYELIPVKYLKDKEKRYKSLRLFVSITDDGNIELYLIDLYHLGINAYNFNIDGYSLDRNYNSNKDCMLCISKIADEYE